MSQEATVSVVQTTDQRASRWEQVRYYLAPIQALLDDDAITEIMVNRYDEIYVERQGAKTRVECAFEDEKTLETAVTQIATALKQDCHPQTQPRLDARLPNGARVNALLYPYSPRGTSMTIRLFPAERLSAPELMALGSFTQAMCDYLRTAMREEHNIVIAGSTGSGKTTLLNVLGNFIPDSERIITIEDTMELQINKAHVLPREAAARDAGSPSPVTMNTLLQNTLRENPDRIIVGEIRSSEAAQTYLTALNTGHSGIVTTIHANSCLDALDRIDDLVSEGSNKPFEAIQRAVRRNIDIVIFARKFTEPDKTKRRRIAEVMEIRDGQGVMVWQWQPQTGAHVRCT